MPSGNFTHGHAGRKNMTPEYIAYRNMRARCSQTNRRDYKHYGGRGIKVCETWLASFQAFFDDMGPRPSHKHTLDRIDTDGNYCPENCRWVTQKVQTRNQRRTHWITFNGKTQSMMDWAEELGVSYTMIRQRLNVFGWTVERSLTEMPWTSKRPPRIIGPTRPQRSSAYWKEYRLRQATQYPMPRKKRQSA